MKQLVLGCAISMALMGCTSTEVVEFNFDNTAQVAQSYADVQWLTATPNTYLDFKIDQTNQTMNLDSGKSSIAAFNVDTQGKELEIEIVSQFKNTVFYPNAMLLNHHHEILKVFGDDDFKYKHAHGMNGDRLVAQAKIQPVGNQTVKLLIYTTPELTQGESEVIHPVKLDAIARGNYPPDVPNPVIPHSPYGHLGVLVSVDEAIVVEESVVVASSDVAQQEFGRELAEGEQATDVSPSIVVGSTEEQAQTGATQAQANFYITGIENAVEAGMLDKALALLDEAKALNIGGAQEAFIKAVNKQ